MIKSKGAYYTPEDISDLIAKHVLSVLKVDKQLSILEPSCGDGSIVKAVISANAAYCYDIAIDAVEINSLAIQIAKESINKTTHGNRVKFHHDDFLTFENNTAYDLIIGNPPYINRKLMDSDQKEKCQAIHNSVNLGKHKITNIWTAFLIKSVGMLNDNGMLALVLPSELLQVNYAADLRTLLINTFERIDIITFDNLIFTKLQQDTLVVLCSKISKAPGLYFDTIASIDGTVNVNSRLNMGSLSPVDKWSCLHLSEDELNLLRYYYNKMNKVDDYCSSVAGIVTAANDYFIINDDTDSQYELSEYSKPILLRGSFVNGGLVFTASDYNQIAKSGKPCRLIYLNNLDGIRPENIMSYLEIGLEGEIHNRYKCLDRKVWYHIPNVWTSEGFFFKRCHEHPKVIVNEANVLVTDTAYRITMLKNYDIKSLTYSFYNSFTLAYAEISGRYYGGGVLELTPNEFKNLPLPYSKISKSKFDSFSKKYSAKKQISDILIQSDTKLLHDKLGISHDVINQFQSIYIKLLSRRLKRKI